jgi:hypothetical protein
MSENQSRGRGSTGNSGGQPDASRQSRTGPEEDITQSMRRDSSQPQGNDRSNRGGDPQSR